MKLMIEFYITICILLLIFNMMFVLNKNIEIMYFGNSSKHFQRYILKTYGKYNTMNRLDKKDKKKINRKLGKVKYLAALHETMQMLKPIDTEFEEDIKRTVWNQVDKYLNKNNEEQGYFAYVLSTFNYSSITECDDNMIHFISFLKTDSLYTLTNAMSAICRFNNPYMVHLAIEIINTSHIFYHKKLLTQELLNFKGDQEELKQILISNFKQYNNTIKEGILDYFRLKELEASDFCMEILEDEKEDNEIIYASMRYMAKNPTEKAKMIFQNILNKGSDDWIKEMLAINGLIRFKDSFTKELIYGKVTDINWDVRSNAIKYFVINFPVESDLKAILKLKDKYTNESLIYQYKQISEEAKNMN